MNLTQNEKDKLIYAIQNNQTIDKEFIYKLFADEEDVFLFWNGRKEDVTNVALPFHHIEHIDEPRKEQSDDNPLFDTKGRQKAGWHNKLIWGDNKLILSSLANGPLREEIEKEGGLKLVYIDPPFAVGADFSHTIELNGETATKNQSVLEEIAYRDTWQRGISSYLSMIYERLKLIHNLLAEDGSIYVHVDWKVSNYLKIILDDIFGQSNFRNELIWHYQTYQGQVRNYFPRKHDIIFFYAKSTDTEFKLQKDDNPEQTIDFTRWNQYLNENNEITGANYPVTDSRFNGYYQRFVKENHRKPGPDDVIFKIEGNTVDSVWDIKAVDPKNLSEKVGYPTQKPEALLERILKASSNEGDLVADFFCGSGTTPAVAEKLNRKWLACDLGRFAIHTTRKRLIGVQRELKESGKDFRAFEVLNLGKYERQFFLDDLVNGARKQKEETYLDLITKAYFAQRITGYSTLHAKKSNRFIHIGPVDMPVTQSRLTQIFDECKENIITSVDVLGFDFEMGLQPRIIQEYKEKGVDVKLKIIPKDVFDPRAVEKKQVKFYDVSYLDAKAILEGNIVSVQLTDFVTNYTQDDIEEIQQSIKKGSKVVIENGQIVKITKDENGIITNEILTKDWHDWIDYWSVDFDYDSKKEIIRTKNEKGEYEEHWTGNYIFENEWQSFRTKQNRTLEFESADHIYTKKGKIRIMVKVVDILGIDSSKIIEIDMK